MPLAHFRLRPGASQPRLRRPLRLHSRLFAGSVAVLLGVLATGAGAASGGRYRRTGEAGPGPAAARDSEHGAGAGLRSQRPDLRPQHAGGRDPGRPSTPSRPQQVDDEMGTKRYALLFKPGTYGSAAEPAHRPGRLLHGGRRPGRLAHRRHHQRARRRLQPVPDRGQLHRAEQLLALVVEPDHQRHRPRRLPRFGQLLGRLAGLADAAGQHHRRQPLPDGLLHRRTAVRQRRLHRRLEDRQRHQRLPAAVLRARQQHRRLVQRGLEPGLLRRGGRPGAVLPEPAVHHPGRAPRSAGRSRTSTSTPPASTTSSSRRSARTPPAPRGRTARRPGRSIPLSEFFVARPGRLGQDHQLPARPRQEPAASPRASTTSTRRSRSSGPTPSCSGSAWPRSPPSTAPCR